MKICRAGLEMLWVSISMVGRKETVSYMSIPPGLSYVRGASHGHWSQSQGILHLCQNNLESKYLKMTFKLFNFSLSIFVSLSLFSLFWSISLKAKISRKKTIFFASKQKKIGLFSLIFALSENERRTLSKTPTPVLHNTSVVVWNLYCVRVIIVQVKQAVKT